MADHTLYEPRPFVHRYPPQHVHYGAGGATDLAELLAERGVERALLICGARTA